MSIMISSKIVSGSSGYHGSLENLRGNSVTRDSLVNLNPAPVMRNHPTSRASRPSAVLQGIQDLAQSQQSTVLQDPSTNQIRRLSTVLQDSESPTTRPGHEYVIISDVKLTRNKKRSKSPGAFTRIFGKSRSRRSLALTDREAMEGTICLT